MKNIIRSLLVMSFTAATLAGCALLGSDVRSFDNIKETHIKVFDKSPSACRELTSKAIKYWEANIFQTDNKSYIIAMGFNSLYQNCIDTTEVGIFYTDKENGKTEVKVASLNYPLSAFVAGKLFEYIDKDGKVAPEKGGAEK